MYMKKDKRPIVTSKDVIIPRFETTKRRESRAFGTKN